MSYTIIQPPYNLRPYIKQYWEIDNVLSFESSYSHRIIPSGLIELSFYLQNIPQASLHSRSVESPIVVSGQQTEFYDIIINKPISLFSITFTPLGASLYFKKPMHTFSNYTISLQEIQKYDYNILMDSILKTQSIQERIHYFNNYFISHFFEKTITYQHKRIGNTLSLLYKTKGNISLSGLYNNAFLSKKQFGRTFKATIGLTPKQFMKVLRLQHTLYIKQHSPTISLTQLSIVSGYYDQAHMIHDFKQLTGHTPRQYFKECDPYSDYFS